MSDTVRATESSIPGRSANRAISCGGTISLCCQHRTVLTSPSHLSAPAPIHIQISHELPEQATATRNSDRQRQTYVSPNPTPSPTLLAHLPPNTPSSTLKYRTLARSLSPTTTRPLSPLSEAKIRTPASWDTYGGAGRRKTCCRRAMTIIGRRRRRNRGNGLWGRREQRVWSRRPRREKGLME